MEFIFLTFFITTVMIGVARSSSTVKGPESDLSLTSSAESLPVEEITEKVEISATTTNNLFYDLFSKCYNFFFGNYDSKSTSSDIVESVPEIVKEVSPKTINVVSTYLPKTIPMEEFHTYITTVIKLELKLYQNFFVFLKKHITNEEFPEDAGIQRFHYLGEKSQAIIDFATHMRLLFHLQFCKETKYVDHFITDEDVLTYFKTCENNFKLSTDFIEKNDRQYIYLDESLKNMETYLTVNLEKEQKSSTSTLIADFCQAEILDVDELTYIYDEFFPHDSFIANFEPYNTHITESINTLSFVLTAL